MLDALRKFRTRLLKLDRTLAQVKAAQVSSQKIRGEAQAIVDEYFRAIRPPILAIGVTDDVLSALDLGMHMILESSHKHATVPVYRAYTKSCISRLDNVERCALLSASENLMQQTLDDVDQSIVATLASMVPSAALSYEQAIRDLVTDNRLSWRGPATDLREALRETLDYLAPDTIVEAEPGYKHEKNASHPTMKQKVRHVLSKRGLGKSSAQSPESSVMAVEETVGTFVRSVYTRSNVSTHTPTDRNEVLRVRDWVKVVLCELLQIRM